MDLAILVYLIALLPHVGAALMLAVIIAGTITTGFALAIANHTFDTTEYSWNLNRDGTLKDEVVKSRTKMKTLVKWSLSVFLISGFFAMLLPSERTAYMMVGAYSAQKVAENPKVQEMSGKVLKIVESKLDKYVEEAEKKVVDEVDKKMK